MIDRIASWFAGSVRFEALCPEPERLVNRLREQKLSLRGLCFRGETLCGRVPPGDYRRLARTVRQCGGRCRAKNRRGFWIWKRRFRRRYGLLVGLVFWGCFLVLAPRFLWEIRLPDCSAEARVHLLQLLDAQGIAVGMPIADLTAADSADWMLQNSDDFGWIALNRTGSILEIEVSERVDAPAGRPEIPCDLVASRAGEVVSVTPLLGVAVVEPGDVVLPGELLISGMTGGAYTGRFTAQGSVLARTVRCEEKWMAFIQSRQRVTQSNTRYGLELMGLWIPLGLSLKAGEGETVETITDTRPLVLEDHTLPFAFRCITETAVAEEPVTLSEETVKAKLREAFEALEAEELADAQILSMEESWRVTPSGVGLQRRYTCIEEITRMEALTLPGESVPSDSP